MDLCIAGFSCKNFSLLNKHRLRAKVKDVSQSSAKTLAGVLDYAASHRPRYVLLENVRGVLRKTSDSKNSAAVEIVSMFSEIGYHGVFMPVDTRWYLLPQRRTRVYFFFKDVSKMRMHCTRTCLSTMTMLKRPRYFDLLRIIDKTSVTFKTKPKKGCMYKAMHDDFAEKNDLSNLFTHEARVAFGIQSDRCFFASTHNKVGPITMPQAFFGRQPTEYA